MDDCVAELANRPESPNLFWALSALPPRQTLLRHSLDVESQWAFQPVPNLVKIQLDQQLSAEQWRTVIANIQRLVNLDSFHGTQGQEPLPDVVKQASKKTLEKATSEYVAAHHLTAKQAAEVERICGLGDYYVRQFEIAYDEWSKCRGLAYPALIEEGKKGLIVGHKN